VTFTRGGQDTRNVPAELHAGTVSPRTSESGGVYRDGVTYRKNIKEGESHLSRRRASLREGGGDQLFPFPGNGIVSPAGNNLLVGSVKDVTVPRLVDNVVAKRLKESRSKSLKVGCQVLLPLHLRHHKLDLRRGIS